VEIKELEKGKLIDHRREGFLSERSMASSSGPHLIILTGASRGYGQAVAEEYAERESGQPQVFKLISRWQQGLGRSSN